MEKRLFVKGAVVLIVLVAPLFAFLTMPGSLRAETTLFEKSRAETFAQLGIVAKPAKPMRFGVVIITLANPFWVSVKDGYEHAAKEFGIQMDLQAAPQENSVTDQLNVLENMVAKGYDVIMAHPITAQNLIPGLVKATEKGIITLTETRTDLAAARQAGAKPIAFEMVNFYAQGKAGAEYIAQKLKKTGGGKVAIIEGLPGAPQSEARRDAAKDVFNSDPSLKLVSVQPGDWDRMKAYNATTNILQAHPDLKGLMCANDVMALAALEAIDAAGKKGQVVVVGIDLIAQAKEAISQGRLAGSVAFSPFIIGEMATRAAIAAYAGKQIPQDLHVSSILATKENIHLLSDWK
ncbi:MAG: substrate-binding domain-containing protein [Syntrophorhabdales bacterium]|jgi:ABC-type sugar transport system substrate-binding protein